MSRLIAQKYEVLERVGEGAIFQVVKARDVESGRIVCIKSPFSSFASDPVFCLALRKTAQELSNLQGPSIASIESVEVDDDKPVLVTEFVRGINLKERIRRIAPFTLSISVDIAITIAEAAQTAHRQGIIHGDLRPHNIIVSPEGVLKVTDFGFWNMTACNSEAVGASLGRSVHYQSGEVATGMEPNVSSDLYSLGVILYEMMTGSLPYTGDAPLLVAMKHQNEIVPSPRSMNPGVPRSLEGITIKLLQKRPQDRYRSADSLLIDLRMVRDALRFGRSLSWSPIENTDGGNLGEVLSQSVNPALPIEAGSNTNNAMEHSNKSNKGINRMPTMSNDDRVSPFIKLALGTVVVLLLGVGIIGGAYWMATFAKPNEQVFPKLVGMKLDVAEPLATKAGIRLMVHEEYNDKVDVGQIVRLDPDLTGREVRAGRSINAWISKGSRLVYVPQIVGLGKDEAETKIKEAGMVLGEVSRSNNPKVPFDYVISQALKPRSRVNRDTAVNLVLSDGPGPDDSPDPTNNDNPAPKPTIKPDEGTDTSPAPRDTVVKPPTNTDPPKPRTFTLTTKVDRDGLGPRQVRFEYEDAEGTHVAVSEMHDEGETITARVSVVGKKIIARTYYGENKSPAHEVTRELP